ncbi:hypothetical protein CRYUN_Cryun24cG0075000 [Craigia yunnanensis]
MTLKFGKSMVLDTLEWLEELFKCLLTWKSLWISFSFPVTGNVVKQIFKLSQPGAKYAAAAQWRLLIGKMADAIQEAGEASVGRAWSTIHEEQRKDKPHKGLASSPCSYTQHLIQPGCFPVPLHASFLASSPQPPAMAPACSLTASSPQVMRIVTAHLKQQTNASRAPPTSIAATLDLHTQQATTRQTPHAHALCPTRLFSCINLI